MKRSAIMIVVLLSFMTISSAMGSIAAPNDVITENGQKRALVIEYLPRVRHFGKPFGILQNEKEPYWGNTMQKQFIEKVYLRKHERVHKTIKLFQSMWLF